MWWIRAPLREFRGMADFLWCTLNPFRFELTQQTVILWNKQFGLAIVYHFLIRLCLGWCLLKGSFVRIALSITFSYFSYAEIRTKVRILPNQGVMQTLEYICMVGVEREGKREKSFTSVESVRKREALSSFLSCLKIRTCVNNCPFPVIPHFPPLSMQANSKGCLSPLLFWVFPVVIILSLFPE